MPGLDAGPQRDLLAVLAARGRERIDQGLFAPAFPPRLNELLQEGRLIGERRDLFLQVAARHGLDLANVEQVLEPQGYRAQPPGPGRLEGWWREAQESVARIDLALAPIRAKVETYDWNYRAGAGDRRRLLVYIRIAEEEAWLTVGPGNRRVAEEAACSAPAVLRSNKRLRNRGWLRRCRSATRLAAYRIQLPWEPAPSQPLPCRSSTTGGENGSLRAKTPTHDIGLAFPNHTVDVFEHVTERPQKTLAIANAVQLSRRRTLKILRALEPAGLVISTRGQAGSGRPAGMWTRGPLSLDEAYARLGVAGAIEERRKALKKDHARDREKLLERQMGPQPRMSSLAAIRCSDIERVSPRAVSGRISHRVGRLQTTQEQVQVSIRAPG